MTSEGLGVVFNAIMEQRCAYDVDVVYLVMRHDPCGYTDDMVDVRFTRSVLVFVQFIRNEEGLIGLVLILDAEACDFVAKALHEAFCAKHFCYGMQWHDGYL